MVGQWRDDRVSERAEHNVKSKIKLLGDFQN